MHFFKGSLTGLYGHMSEKLINLVDSLAIVRTIAFSDITGSTLQVSRSMFTIVWYSPFTRCCTCGVICSGGITKQIINHKVHGEYWDFDQNKNSKINPNKNTYDYAAFNLLGQFNVSSERVLVVLAFDEYVTMHVVLVQLVLEILEPYYGYGLKNEERRSTCLVLYRGL